MDGLKKMKRVKFTSPITDKDLVHIEVVWPTPNPFVVSRYPRNGHYCLGILNPVLSNEVNNDDSPTTE
jgi:hypothetical protein